MSEQQQEHKTGNQENLGMAGNLAKSFLHSPLSPMLLIACFSIGMIGMIFTPRQEDPQISVPMIDIFVSYPGASSREVASLVAEPLERIMSEITGVKHVYSASARDQAMVTVEFDVGQQMGASLVKLYDKLESNKDIIPPGVTEPLVKPKGVDDVPVVTLTFWSEKSQVDDAALRMIALGVRQKLGEVINTSQSFVVSGRSEQLRVEVKPEKLASYNITLDQIANTIRAANSERAVGNMETGTKSFKIRTGQYLRNAHDVETLVVGLYRGQSVFLRDVAEVNHGPGETHKMVNYYTGPASDLDIVANGEAAVTLAIAKKEGSNGVAVAEEVLKKIEYLKGRDIPDNVQVSVTRNYGKTANDKVNSLMLKLFIATALVTILIWFFLSWRAAVVVAVVIPVVILVTVFFALIMGLTIDRVSLFALIFAIGILVDDAIVVVENMYRRWLLKGEMDDETSVDAVREVGNPTILATFTVVAALLPMAAVRGMMGPYMAPIPALGTVAMLFSLFAAFMFTPWLVVRLRPTMKNLEEMEHREERQNAKLEGFFRRLLIPLIDSKFKGYLFLFSLFAMFFASLALFYTKDVRVKMLPLDNKPEFNVVVNFPEGTALTESAALVESLVTELRTQEEVTALQSYVGTASPFNFNGLVRHYYLRQFSWQADIQVQLLDKGVRKKRGMRTSHDVAKDVRQALTDLAEKAGAKIQVVEMPPGPPVLQSVVAEIYGPSTAVREDLVKNMTRFFEDAEYLTDVDNYLQEKYEIWKFNIDREKAIRTGVTVEDVNRTLEMAMGGYVLGDIKDGALLDPTLIVLQVPLAVRVNFANLMQLPVPTRGGGAVPLSEIGVFEKDEQDRVTYHKDLRNVEYVTAETQEPLAAPVYGMMEVQAMLDEYTTKDGHVISGHWLGPPADDSMSGFEWAGEWTVTYETFRDMGIAFGVAIILIYMLVVWEFGNFVLPAVIMAPIPLTLVGIVPGHWILDAEFTATSMIGFIALAGIIVRNSILLVDYSWHAVQGGLCVRDAVIDACKARTRPILITALALVFGSMVIITDPIFQGMAISLLFGVMVSTILTLLVIPLGCISSEGKFCPVPEPGMTPVCSIPEKKDSGNAQKSAQAGDEKKKTERGLIANIFYYTWLIIRAVVLGIFALIKGFFGLFTGGKKASSSVNAAATSKNTVTKSEQEAEKAGTSIDEETNAQPAAKSTDDIVEEKDAQGKQSQEQKVTSESEENIKEHNVSRSDAERTESKTLPETESGTSDKKADDALASDGTLDQAAVDDDAQGRPAGMESSDAKAEEMVTAESIVLEPVQPADKSVEIEKDAVDKSKDKVESTQSEASSEAKNLEIAAEEISAEIKDVQKENVSAESPALNEDEAKPLTDSVQENAKVSTVKKRAPAKKKTTRKKAASPKKTVKKVSKKKTTGKRRGIRLKTDTPEDKE